MDRLKLVDKLKDKANISYEEAKMVLEENSWNIIDAIMYLENKGILQKPSVNIFYTNNEKDTYENNKQIVNINKKTYSSKKESTFDGFFEMLCKAIDMCNNILIEIKRGEKIFFKIPLTVVILLLFFAFWIIIPIVVIALFLDVEFLITSKNINTYKINQKLSYTYKFVKLIKEKIKKGV